MTSKSSYEILMGHPSFWVSSETCFGLKNARLVFVVLCWFYFLSLNTCMKLCLYSSNLCVHIQTRIVLYSSVASLTSLAKVKPGV